MEYLAHENGDEFIFLPHVIFPGDANMWAHIRKQAESDILYGDKYKMLSGFAKQKAYDLIVAMAESQRLKEHYRYRWYDIAFLKDKQSRKEAYEEAYRTIEKNAIEIATLANTEIPDTSSPHITTLYFLKRLCVDYPGFCDPTGTHTLGEGLNFLTGVGWKAEVQNYHGYFGVLPGVYNIYPKSIPDIKAGNGHH